MNATRFVDEVSDFPKAQLPEVPRFFETPSACGTSPLETEEGLEPGEAQFRRDFQARWWPGNMSVYSPAPKG